MWCRLAIIPDLAGRINRCVELVERAPARCCPIARCCGRDVGAADPAVDTKELDAIVLTPEHAFSGRCQPQLEAREELTVAERRRRGKWRAVAGFDEPGRSLPERA